MGIRGKKPSIEAALTKRETFVPTGLVDGISRPADLSEDAAAVWDVLLSDLTEMGVFRPADAIVLTEVCEMVVEAKKLRYRMQNPPAMWFRFEPDLTENDKDVIGLDEDQLAEFWPLSTTYKRLRVAYLQTMRSLKSWIDEFGVTPVARLRLGLLQLQGANLMDAFGGTDDEDDVAPAAIEGTIVEQDGE